MTIFNFMKKTKNNEKNNEDIRKKQNANLKPIKPGESRNPKGRPKGKLNFDTRIDLAIDALAEAYVNTQNKDPKNKNKQITINDVDIEGDIFKQYLNKARAGDNKFALHFMDRRHGKAVQPVELTGKDGKAIEFSVRLQKAREKARAMLDRFDKKDGNTQSSK